MHINELTAADHLNRAVVSGAYEVNPGRLALLVGRMRFQIFGGALFAVVVPALARAFYQPYLGVPIELDKSLFGTVFAFLFGYVMFRKVTSFPGVRATAFILPVFVAAYALTALAFFFLRLEYSRLQLGVSFALSVAFFYWIFITVRRIKRLRLSVVPGGDVGRLMSIGTVDWNLMTSPSCGRTSGGIVADLKSPLSEDWERFIADKALAGVPIYDARQVLESLSGRVRIEHLSENPFGTLTPSTIYASGKFYLDFMLAAAVLVAVGPVLLLTALAIRLDSPGPAIFRQERMGHRGRVFKVYKLRTMRLAEPASENLETQMTLAVDPRITRVGRLLRKTRIDELPQLINILRGEMSWIGPRPEALRLSVWYEEKIPFYRYRHIVRPGLTGWAQVNQGHVTSLDDADLKLQYDFFYVKNFSLWLDILVLLRTVRVVLTGAGAK